MKKVLLMLICVASTYSLFAQDGRPAPRVDSTSLDKPRKVDKADLKPIEGTTMIPAADIEANIRTSANLSLFFSAIKAGGLRETFRSKGPITILAPDNDAMAAIPKGKLDTLLRADHKYDLIALVTYHILGGKITLNNISKQIRAGKGKATLTTLAGNRLTAVFGDGKTIILIDELGRKSRIKRSNLEQNNGLIHFVDNALIPAFENI